MTTVELIVPFEKELKKAVKWIYWKHSKFRRLTARCRNFHS